MSRLPTPGADNGNWGAILNEYLTQSLDGEGNLKPSSLATAGTEMVAAKNQPNGYAGLDNNGLIDSAQLPLASNGAGAYIGVYADVPESLSGEFMGVDFTSISAQLDTSSLHWDPQQPNRVTVLKTGVYAVTAGAYWRDEGASGPITLQVISSCQFNFADIRPAIGDGVTQSVQYLNTTMFLQANQSIRININQTLNVTLAPLITMLVTRCS